MWVSDALWFTLKTLLWPLLLFSKCAIGRYLFGILSDYW